MRQEGNDIVVDLEDEGGHEPGNQMALKAENDSQWTASKETGTSVLQPLGTEFCQQPEFRWKHILL